MQDDQQPVNPPTEPVEQESPEQEAPQTMEPVTEEEQTMTEADGMDTSEVQGIEETPDAETSEEEEVDAASDSEEPQRTADINPGTGQALDIMTIENMINAQMVDIEKMKEEMKLVKSSYDDTFKNDAKFKELDDKAREAGKVKNTYKQTLLKEPAVAELSNKLDGLKGEVKDLQDGLSDYLREYYRLSGMTQFETKDGEVLQIVNVFKLVKQAK